MQINGGVTRSALFDAAGWSGGLGYRVGVSVPIALRANTWLEPEIAWSRRTTVATGSVDGGTLKSTIALQYIEVPVVVNHTFWRHPRFAPLVLGGAYYARNVSAHSRNEIGSNALDEDLGTEVGRNDAGVIVGGGVQFQKAGRTWTVEARYLAGIPNLYLLNAGSKWRTRSLTTSVGVRW